MDHSQDSAIVAAAVLEEQNQQEEEQPQQQQQQQQQQEQQQSRDRDSNNKALPTTHAMPSQQEHRPSTSRDEVRLTVHHPGIGTV